MHSKVNTPIFETALKQEPCKAIWELMIGLHCNAFLSLGAKIHSVHVQWALQHRHLALGDPRLGPDTQYKIASDISAKKECCQGRFPFRFA